MSKEYDAEIQGEKFTGALSQDGKFISIYDVISEDDGDFLGQYSLDKDGNIIQYYEMSGTSKVIGKLLKAKKEDSFK